MPSQSAAGPVIGPSRGLSLIGYRGAGKSAIGRRLGLMADKRFLDIDHEIERQLGRKISAIFATEGEAGFRDHEQAILEKVLASSLCAVVATGGGAILRPANREGLRRFGLVVWLDAPIELLAQRLAADPSGRPSLTAQGLVQEVATVLEFRRPLYQQTADIVIPVAGKRVDELARELLDAWTQWAGRPEPDSNPDNRA